MSEMDNIGNGSSGSYDASADNSLNQVENTIANAKQSGSANQHSFPSDLQNIMFYPEQIKFSIYRRLGIDLQVLKKTIITDVDNFAKGGKDAIKAAQDKNDAAAVKAAEEQAKKSLIGQVKDTSVKLFNRIEEGIKLRQGLNTVDNLKSTIYLPMPKENAFNESISWASSELGAVGAVMSGDLQGAAAGTALASAAMGMGGATGGILGSIMGGGVGGAVVGALASDGVQKGIESALGIKKNPFKEQTFEGIDFRKFSFSWTFNPASETEVLDLHNIIQTFRALSKPSFTEGKGGIFNYPHEYQIEFLTYSGNTGALGRGKQVDETLDTNPHLPQLKYCVCTAVNTNFATKEWRSFQGGAPIEVSLQLDFEETELITEGDVMGSTSVGRFKRSGRKF
jgi:hypothetical protein